MHSSDIWTLAVTVFVAILGFVASIVGARISTKSAIEGLETTARLDHAKWLREQMAAIYIETLAFVDSRMVLRDDLMSLLRSPDHTARLEDQRYKPKGSPSELGARLDAFGSQPVVELFEECRRADIDAMFAQKAWREAVESAKLSPSPVPIDELQIGRETQRSRARELDRTLRDMIRAEIRRHGFGSAP